jgi:uncharacterized protein (DUF1330 family)
VLLLGGQKSPPVITHDLFGALGRTIACVDAEIIGGLDHLAPEELQRSSQSACGTTCPSGNSESPHLRDCKPENGPVMSPQDQPITLAFVGYANAATAERASAYEDEVLRLLESYDARLLFRGRRTHDQDDSLPLEIQLMSFASRSELDAFYADERRQILLTQYGDVFTRKHAVELEAIQPLRPGQLAPRQGGTVTPS